MSTETFEITASAGVEDLVDGQQDELVDAEPAADDVVAEFPHDRLGPALVFAFLTAMGLGLAVFATPTPVVVAGWVIAALAGIKAGRELAGGDAR